jgi:hypothetical protein
MSWRARGRDGRTAQLASTWCERGQAVLTQVRVLVRDGESGLVGFTG